MKLAQKRKQSLAFGGQALLEGVMFRSRTHIVMCIRLPDNEILTHAEETVRISERYRVLELPFLRGIAAFFETLYLGVKSIYFSVNAVLEEEEKLTPKELAMVVTLTLALISFFYVTPFILTTLFNFTGVFFSIVEALLRLTILLLYLTLVSTWGEYKRLLQYHGAEHKTVNAHEAGAALNVESVQRFSKFHPRCGTSSLFIVVIVSILLFSIIPKLSFFARLASRVLLIPVIGAVSYELLMLSDKYKNSIITRILITPGLALQRLTAKEPDDDMTEVAIKAVKEINRLTGSQSSAIHSK